MGEKQLDCLAHLSGPERLMTLGLPDLKVRVGQAHENVDAKLRLTDRAIGMSRFNRTSALRKAPAQALEILPG